MMKSERDDLFLQQQVFDKITKTARDEDDFSIFICTNRTKVSKSSDERRRHRKNKRVISEVRKRVQEAHLKSSRSASGLGQNANIVPRA